MKNEWSPVKVIPLVFEYFLRLVTAARQWMYLLGSSDTYSKLEKLQQKMYTVMKLKFCMVKFQHILKALMEFGHNTSIFFRDTVKNL